MGETINSTPQSKSSKASSVALTVVKVFAGQHPLNSDHDGPAECERYQFENDRREQCRVGCIRLRTTMDMYVT